MRRLAASAATALACATLSGCFIIPPPKPFVRDIPARQLNPVDVAAMAALPAIAGTPAAPELTIAAAAPERTDIQGAGDGSMEVEDVVVVRGSRIQQRAPNYSSEQTAAIVCGAMKGDFGVDGARRMHAATVKTEKARLDFDAERITGKQLDAIELERQDAVIGYMLPVPILNWMITPTEKKSDLPPPRQGSVSLENTDLFAFTENGRSVTAVSGIARNSGAERVAAPPLTLRALDQWEYSVAGQTSLLPFETLEAGEAKPFEVRFLNPPANMAEVYVHFAPPFLYRTRRDCEFFDPATFNPSASLTAPETIAAAEGDYIAGELNQLTQVFRRESEQAWRCQVDGRCDPAQAAQRISWRDMFLIAESADEAWVALAAAEAMRARAGAGAESDKAETAQQAAMQRLRTLGAQTLARAGGSVADVVVAVTQSTYGRDAVGLFVEIAGTLTNTGAVERRIDSLMVAFVDRLELPLSSVAIAVDRVLAPGETLAFGRRLEAGAARGTAGVQMAWGEKREAAPARIPPRDIPWQVRVGAMGRTGE